MCRQIHLGIDFDNTLVNYSNVFYQAALKRGLVTANIQRDKRNIRDRIRELPNGEIKWQELQAFIYGERISGAVLFNGAKKFLNACRKASIPISIISHKTSFAPMDKKRINLIDAAKDWIEKNGFFDKNGPGLSREKFFFEPTRLAKIERIKQVGCTHFIDDLEETFLENTFPPYIEKILFSETNSQLEGVKTFRKWEEIYDYFFVGKVHEN